MDWLVCEWKLGEMCVQEEVQAKGAGASVSLSPRIDSFGTSAR